MQGRYKLKLRVYHPTRSADEITSVVGLQPVVCQSVGTARVTPKGRPLKGTYSQSYCLFEIAEGELDAATSALEDAVMQFEGAQNSIQILTKGGGETFLALAIFTGEESGLEFPNSLLGRISALGVGIMISSYLSNEPDGQPG